MFAFIVYTTDMENQLFDKTDKNPANNHCKMSHICRSTNNRTTCFFINKVTGYFIHTLVLIFVKAWCNIKYTYWFPSVITWMNNWHNARHNYKANYHILPILCDQQHWIIYIPNLYISELRVKMLDYRLIFTSGTRGNSRLNAWCGCDSNFTCITD